MFSLLFISVSSLVDTPKLIIPIILASLSLQVSYVTLVIHFPSYPEILVMLLLFICSGYRIQMYSLQLSLFILSLSKWRAYSLDSMFYLNVFYWMLLISFLLIIYFYRFSDVFCLLPLFFAKIIFETVLNHSLFFFVDKRRTESIVVLQSQ